LNFIKNSLIAILRGEFLLRLKLEKYFLHVIYTFVLFAAIIWVSLLIENSMAKVEDNNRAIEELLIENSQKTFELEQICRRSSVTERLDKMGSDVKPNRDPAYKLVNGK